jgi:hypothetical protein
MTGRVRVVHCRSVGIFFWLEFRNRLSPGRDHKEDSPVLSARFGEQVIAPDNLAHPCKLSASSLFGLRRNRELDSQAIIPDGIPFGQRAIVEPASNAVLVILLSRPFVRIVLSCDSTPSEPLAPIRFRCTTDSQQVAELGELQQIRHRICGPRIEGIRSRLLETSVQD